MPKKIFILGSGQSLIDYKYKDGDVTWCPYSMYSSGLPITQYFGMHESEIGIIDGIIDLSNYPIEEISNKYESCFFTNTVSYMLAYALYIGVEEIDIYGVDMNLLDEYYMQRPSVLYWVGYLRANGVKVNVRNYMDLPSKIYGYESNESLRNKIEQHRKHAFLHKENVTDEAQKNQYIGFLYALDVIEKEL